MTIRRSTWHTCPICKTDFKGEGSKDRARECRELGEPNPKYSKGDLVKISNGRKKGEYFVIEAKYRRRVIRKKGKVEKAYHVIYYRLQPRDNRKKILWPWPSESMIKLIRSAS